MAILDVWISKPGAVCCVDDADWNITIFDAHGAVFQWAGTTYAYTGIPNDPFVAHHGHWVGRVPPGTYVVQARAAQGSIITDHAIAVVECEDTVCVHLFVPFRDEGRPPSDEPCKLTINEVTGIGEPVPNAVRVVGSALGCANVEVTVFCATEANKKTTVPVSSSGAWKALFKDIRQLECQCGGRVRVVARCVEHPDCIAEFANDLHCEHDGH